MLLSSLQNVKILSSMKDASCIVTRECKTLHGLQDAPQLFAMKMGVSLLTTSERRLLESKLLLSTLQ